jgi:hypothetical protein
MAALPRLSSSNHAAIQGVERRYPAHNIKFEQSR